MRPVNTPVTTDCESQPERRKSATAAPPTHTAPSSVTVVIPTYHEAANIPHLIARLRSVRDASGLDIDVLFMDDDSQDGSREIVESMGLPWVRMVTRTTNRGLSPAVLEGLMLAQGDTLVVMDADLSHPPEKIPELLSALDSGMEAAVGSRFTEGGSTADDWGLLRWLNSRIATLLALPLTTLSDPMSGFFAIRKSTVLAGRDFNPVGYKILLELIIKCRCRRIADIPIHFENRQFGESKLTFREQLKYIQHLRRLYTSKFGTWSHLVQFLAVGLSGLFVNLAALTALLHGGLSEKLAVAISIAISMVWNFMLNRRFSFSYARHQSIIRQFLGFVAACSVGAAVNYATTMELWGLIQYKQIAAFLGVCAGTFFNFVASRFVIFRTRHVKTS